MAVEKIVLWEAGAVEAGEWHANAADGSRAGLSVEAGALRLDLSLRGHGAWAIARRDLVQRAEGAATTAAAATSLPAHYVGVLVVRGRADQPLELQLKLVDPSGANVWWWRRRDWTPQEQSQSLTLRKASLEFAWGPASGGEPTTIAAVEIGLAGGDRDSSGTLWFEALRIEARDPASREPRVRAARASSALPDHPADAVLTADPGSAWCPAAGDREPWRELDLGRTCEFGGVVVDFAE